MKKLIVGTIFGSFIGSFFTLALFLRSAHGREAFTSAITQAISNFVYGKPQPKRLTYGFQPRANVKRRRA